MCFFLLDLPSGRIDSPHPTNHFKLENGLNFVVHLEDILQVRGDAVVTGESPNLSVKSLVTQKLCESGGISFSVWRNMLLRSHRRMEHGKVYDTLLTITNLPFQYSFHAIMYTYQSGNDMEWAFGMDEIYLNIVKKAEEKVLTSIVVPLLGSGEYHSLLLIGYNITRIIFTTLEGNVLFNDALNTFYLRLYGFGHMIKYHSDSEQFSS